MREFLGYYKWHLTFLLLVIICITFSFINMTSTEKPDLTIGYIGTDYVNVQTFNDNKGELELLIRDADGNGESKAEMYAYAVDLQSDLNDTFLEMIEAENYHIFISTKKAFEDVEDKDVFIDANEFVNLKGKKFATLSDKKDRVYAVSLKDNDYMKNMGILNSDNLYIAVAFAEPDEDGDIPMTSKNARNIAGYILGEN